MIWVSLLSKAERKPNEFMEESQFSISPFFPITYLKFLPNHSNHAKHDKNNVLTSPVKCDIPIPKLKAGEIKVRIGYTNQSNIKDDTEILGVDRIYADMPNEKEALHEMIDYVRQGDTIVVSNASILSDTVGELIDFIVKINAKNVYLVCKAEGIDTATSIWQNFIKLISGIRYNNSESRKADTKYTRLEEELLSYFKLVEKKEISVDEVCKRLGIGRSTYYRYWNRLVYHEIKERHPEQFDYYESMVKLGKISVAESCRRMNIGITTYYKMRNEREAEAGQN